MPVWDAASATLFRRIQRLGKQFEDARIREYVYTTARLRFMANRYLVSTSEIAQAQRDGRRAARKLERALGGDDAALKTVTEFALGERGRLKHILKRIAIHNKMAPSPLIADMRSKQLRRNFPAAASPLPAYLPVPPSRHTPRTRADAPEAQGSAATGPLRNVHIRLTESGFCFWNRRGRPTPWRLAVAIKRRSLRMHRLQMTSDAAAAAAPDADDIEALIAKETYPRDRSKAKQRTGDKGKPKG